jgi:transposase
VIGVGSAKLIATGSAKEIRNYWANWGVQPKAAPMTAQRTDMHRLQELVRLHRQGTGAREVARLLGMSPNTERHYREALDEAGALAGDPQEVPELEELKRLVEARTPAKLPPQQVSTIEEWSDSVARLRGKGLGPRAIHDRLTLEEPEYRGSLGAMKRLVARLKREQGPSAEDIAIPVVTEPGDVAQVDFGYVGRQWDPASGCQRKAWVFVMVLGHSRHQFCRTAFDQKTTTWIRLHEEAFRSFGGVPRTLVPDNLKAAVTRAAFGVSDGTAALNRSYRELARHYGFKVDPTPPRSPKKKGKVESGVKYVKRNALVGRDAESLTEVNRYLDRWTVEIAGKRVHGTTGKRPLDVFEAEEQATLMPLPAKRYEPVLWKKATVHRDSHVVFERRMYSVPWRLSGREVWIRATPGTVAIYFDDERQATHRRNGPGQWSTEDSHLPEGREPLRHRSQSYWEERAAALGDDVRDFVHGVFESDDVVSQLRQVQAIVTHLEKYPPARAQAACARAAFYGSTTYQSIKNILLQALDFEPLPTSKAPSAQWADSPRFARGPEEWTRKEVGDERH